MSAWSLIALCIVGLLGLLASRAHGQTEKREVPDYDGREEPTDARELLLWVPRIALFPAYVVSEYVVRRPLGLLITEAERADLPELLYEVFVFGSDGKAGLIPIAFIDFGFEPSVGFYFFWDDVGAKGHDLRVRASTWGDEWLAARVTDRYAITRRVRWTVEASAVRRPDYVFYGVGPRTLESDRSRYRAQRFDAHLGLEVDLWRASRLLPTFGARRAAFPPGGGFDEEPSLRSRVKSGTLPQPAGYDQGYTLLYSRLALVLDSRQPQTATGSGLYLELSVEHDAEVSAARGGFVKYFARSAGFLDLDDRGRVVSLAIESHFVDPLSGEPIPFTELASIGGEHSMRGFFPGRLYDRSALIATLRYRWPIWTFLDGTIHLATGNVFGPQLAGFSAELLRVSAAIGIESVGSPDSAFELLLGVGSETYEQGFELSSVRAIVGTNHGF